MKAKWCHIVYINSTGSPRPPRIYGVYEKKTDAYHDLRNEGFTLRNKVWKPKMHSDILQNEYVFFISYKMNKLS